MVNKVLPEQVELLNLVKDSKMTPERVLDTADNLMKAVWFIYAMIMTDAWLKESKGVDWIPPSLGGRGSLENMTKHIESPEPAVQAVVAFYVVNMAYHLHSLIYHLAFTRRVNDYVQMLVHHVVSVGLIVFSFYGGYHRIGSLVMVLHDRADIMVYVTKTFKNSPYKPIVLISYLGMLCMWFQTRLYVFPSVIYQLYQLPELPLKHALLPMLVTLQVLHVLWFIMMIRMGIRFYSS